MHLKFAYKKNCIYINIKFKNMAGKGRNSEKLTYVCGMTLANVRKMSKFIFQDYYYRANANIEDWRFDIMVRESVWDEDEQRDISFVERFGKNYVRFFHEYWGEKPGLKLIYYKGINIEDVDEH